MSTRIFVVLGVLGLAGVAGYAFWPELINLMLPADSRPGKVVFPVESVTSQEYDAIAEGLGAAYDDDFKHIQSFREAGILAYEGPKTCLKCHATIEVKHPTSGETKTVDLMDDVTASAHYTFSSKRHPNVWGFNGELADNILLGKMNRPCPKPGSFAMTAWAEVIKLDDGREYSEGCGQCHIGGQYQAPLGEMMPGYRTTQQEKEVIDCLICHAVAYDMNRKQVVEDDNGRIRWDQDRSMKAAMSVTRTTAQTCLRCHQHNFGGDIYVDSEDPSFMESLLNTGHERPRVLHPGSKRGTPYSPFWDVHAAAGMACTACHATMGHLMAKGTHTTTMMANDLPDVEVACENCHTAAPHKGGLGGFYNMHVEKVACQTCHIPVLHSDSATARCFRNPKFEAHEGIFIYDDVIKDVDPGEGITYVWWNGDGTFLGNPIGDNPNGLDLYRFYDPGFVWVEFKDFDYETWYEEVMRPIAKSGRPSKLYAMKRFNGTQHIDLQNIGPFGGMYVPYNLPTYYTTGDPDLAAAREMEKSMMKRMYGWMFKYYMMDDFMDLMAIDGWNTDAYEDVVNMQQVQARWIPQDASIEISHGIKKDGALNCGSCHSPFGVIDWKALGYSEEEVAKLERNPLGG